MKTKELKDLLARVKYIKHFANQGSLTHGSLLDLYDSYDKKSWYGREGNEIRTIVLDVITALIEESKSIYNDERIQ
jgi:hypothetical protein